MSEDEKLNMEPYKDMHPTIQEAWKRWFAADYSWEGLNDDLRTYWRTDPLTGELRTDEELENLNELIVVEGQKTYHIMHLPLFYQDGTPTKKTNNDDVGTKLTFITHSRSNISTNDRSLLERSYATGRNGIYHSLNFEGAIFLNFILDNRYQVHKDIYIENAIFTGNSKFNRITFQQKVEFQDAVFCSSNDFIDAKFHNVVTFDKVTFVNGANFLNVEFSVYSHFHSINFYDLANFNNAKFRNNADFQSSHFYGLANFKGAVFERHLILKKATFEKHADFSAAQISGEDFSAARRIPSINASGAKFLGGVSFENRDFLTESSFDGAEFHGIANFHNATLKPFVTFDQAKFYDLKSHPKDNPTYYEKLEGAYRTLKQIFEERRDFVKAGDFFVKELQARRKRPDLKWEDFIFSDGYELLSNFGVSVSRPLIWLIIFLILFALIYGTMNGAYVDAKFVFGTGLNQKFTEAFSVSISRIFPFGAFGEATKDFIGHFKDCAQNNICKTDYKAVFLFQLAATFQSFASLVLSFLIALALRRKFQMN